MVTLSTSEDGKPGRRRYHHGNLAAALLDAAMEMAAEGGPDAVVLREVARRVGVSATAAYRHFDGQAELIEAVKHAALDRLAEHMRAALVGDGAAIGAGAVPLPGIAPGSAAERASRRLEAAGRAYFDFAITQPGLFRCFCIGLPLPGAVQLQDETAFGVLADLLDELVQAGVITERRRAGGIDIALWSAVHGLSVLCLDGPLADLPREQQEHLLTAVTDVLFHGVAGA